MSTMNNRRYCGGWLFIQSIFFLIVYLTGITMTNAEEGIGSHGNDKIMEQEHVDFVEGSMEISDRELLLLPILGGAAIDCLTCARPGADPPQGMCQDYDCGGRKRVHFYTCCEGSDTVFDGASNGTHCGPGGSNEGNGCASGEPYGCRGTAGADDCKDWCDEKATSFLGACWNWQLCFNNCCSDPDGPVGGVPGFYLRGICTENDPLLGDRRLDDSPENCGICQDAYVLDTCPYCGNGDCDDGECHDNCPEDCEPPTIAPTPAPVPATPAPTCTPDSSNSGTSQACPDPHFVTWSGDRYDFHNECDMVHVTNDHLDLHIRTQAIWSEGGHHWSGVVRAALRFDNDVLEVNALEEENPVSVNGVPVTSDSFTLDDMYPVKNTFGRLKKSLKSTESVTVKMSGGQYIKFLIHLDSLVIRMDAHGSDFYGSKGMAGYWDKPGLIGRDGETSYDIKKRGRSHVGYAMEWELDANRGDPVLFSTESTHKCAESPQSPVSIEDVDEGRRLMELETAKDLCDHVAPEGSEWRDECIFDMLATNFDEDVLKNPAYTDPLTSVERCVAAPEEEVAAGTSSDSPNGDGDANGLSCADLGGECVYRCNPTEYDCRPDALCIEATDLTVVDAARRRMRKLEFIEGCSCALPKVMKSSSVVDVVPSTTTSGSDDDDECVDDADFDFAIGDGVRGTSMKKCEWLHEMEGRADEYCETKGSDPDAKTMIKSACRSACADYLSECL